MWKISEAACRDKPLVVPGFRVWDGVYASFAEAPAVGPGFDGATWRDRSMQSARHALAALEAGEPLDYAMRQRNAAMVTVAAMLLSRQSGVLILDFGGGLGHGFMVLSSAVGDKIARVGYHVVDVDVICRSGRALYAKGSGPSFGTDLPAAGSFDLVHASSVMQYVEDWRGAIRRLAGFGAGYLSFGDVFVGGFPTYVTLQNYYDSRIPHWFINAAEFIGEVERQGYELVLKTACDVQVLGAYGPLPMVNFPPALRIPHTSHLLFAKGLQSS